MSAIFSNFVDILHISSALLGTLQSKGSWHEILPQTQASSRIETIGHIFCEFGHYFKMYKTYCRTFQASVMAFEFETQNNRAFHDFLQVPSRMIQLGNMTLQDYLLLPVQRIPRYRLLLQELLKWTPASHQEYADLEKSLRLISEIASSINEAVRQHEAWQELLILQRSILNLDQPLIDTPGRVLLRSADVQKICRKSHQVRTFYLFNDFMMLTKYAPPPYEGSTRIFSRRIALQELFVDILPAEIRPSGVVRHLWQLSTQAKSFRAYCNSHAEAQAWIDAIQAAKWEYCNSRVRVPEHVISSTINIRRCKAPSGSRRPGIDILSRAFWAVDEVEYPILRGRLAPIWMEDSAALDCQICHAQFTFLKGRHHCRICGLLVCAACSGKRFMTSTRSSAYRACDSCHSNLVNPPVPGGLSNTRDPILDGSTPMDVPVLNHATFQASIKRNRAARERTDLSMLYEAG